MNNLLNDQHDALDQATIRTMAEFMIERKDIVVRLLEYTLSCEPVNIINDIIRKKIYILLLFRQINFDKMLLIQLNFLLM